MAKFKAGDTVWVSTYGRPFSEETVTKVGRKFVTVGQNKFDLEKRTLSSGYNGSVRTVDEHSEKEYMRMVTSELAKLGVEVFRSRLSKDQLTQILEIAGRK